MKEILLANAHIQPLETRTLMSATPSLFTTAVLTDRAKLNADLRHFRQDLAAMHATFVRDLAKVKVHKLSDQIKTTVLPLIKQLKTDLAQLHAHLGGDHLKDATAVRADTVTVLKDIIQIKVDTKKNPGAVAADQTKLQTDRLTLQNDIIAAADARIADRQAALDKIFADDQAIVTALGNVTDYNPNDIPAASKLFADHAAGITKLQDDLTALAADRTQLLADLTAMQNT